MLFEIFRWKFWIDQIFFKLALSRKYNRFNGKSQYNMFYYDQGREKMKFENS